MGSEPRSDIAGAIRGVAAPPPTQSATASRQATLKNARSAADSGQRAPLSLAPMQPELIWRAGSGLDVVPVTGPDGSIYVASRQGSLDVLHSNGALRFSVNLNGTPTGAIFVDRRGWAYIGLMTGRVVAFDALGRRQWVFASPNGIRGALRFSEGQGLLFQEIGGHILGLNRGGFPTFRLDPRGHVSAGPIGVFGWCVVATNEGELVWGDRWGKRKRIHLGTSTLELQPTAAGGVWALTQTELVSFSNQRTEIFRRARVRAISTNALASRASTGSALAPGAQSDELEGVILSAEGHLLGLSRAGKVLREAQLEIGMDSIQSSDMTVDAEGNTCIAVERDQIACWDASGCMRGRYAFSNRQLLGQFLDQRGRQNYAASQDGAVFRLR